MKLTRNKNTQFVKAKNGRLMMKSSCTESHHVKTRFVKNHEDGNLVDVLDRIPGFGESRKALGNVIPALVNEPGAKEAFDDFASGDTYKRTWKNITGQTATEIPKECKK